MFFMLNLNTEISSLQHQYIEAGDSVCPTSITITMNKIVAQRLTHFMQSGYEAVRFLITLKENFRFHIHIVSTDNDKASDMYEAMKKHIKIPLSALFQLFLKNLDELKFFEDTSSRGIRRAEFLRELICHPEPIYKIVFESNLFDGFYTSNFARIMYRVFGNDVGDSVQYNLKELEADIDRFSRIMFARVMEFAMDCNFYEGEESSKESALELFRVLVNSAYEYLSKGYLSYLEDLYHEIMIPQEVHLAISFNICNCDAEYGSVSHASII